MNFISDSAIQNDLEYQEEILQHVSRTFALTIPQVPEQLVAVVGNAYLLCRIVDTIEDDQALSVQKKKEFTERFADVVDDKQSAEQFAHDLLPFLSSATPEKEKELILNTASVMRVNRSFSSFQRTSILRCVKIMSHGMAEFQRNANLCGLKDLATLNSYCYHVAGVVGEMLTDLFCDYSNEIQNHRDRLLPLAVAFGQGLQMTNILKDIWDDRRRGVCWLPRDIFLQHGFELETLSTNENDENFVAALHELIGVAHDRLIDALQYVLIIPSHETEIRRHCLWALGMAVLTLRKIHANPNFKSGSTVKISRRNVRSVVWVTSALVRSNIALKLLFFGVSHSLPRMNIDRRNQF